MEEKEMLNADEFFRYTANIICNTFKLMQVQLEEDIKKAADLAVQKYIAASAIDRKKPKGKDKSKYIRGYDGLCDVLGISKSTIIKLKKSNAIPFVQRGRILYFDPEEVKKSLGLK